MDEMPEWLESEVKERENPVRHELRLPPGNREALIELEKQTFEIVFEQVLEHLASGTTLVQFCFNYHEPLSANRLRTWIFRDEGRRKAYYGAKAIGAEAIEDELIRISDGIRPDGEEYAEDVARSTLRVNTRKWVLQVSNRKRYGDMKRVEQTTTTRFDPGAMTTDELQAKIARALGLGGDTFDMGEFDGDGD